MGPRESSVSHTSTSGREAFSAFRAILHLPCQFALYLKNLHQHFSVCLQIRLFSSQYSSSHAPPLAVVRNQPARLKCPVLPTQPRTHHEREMSRKKGSTRLLPSSTHPIPRQGKQTSHYAYTTKHPDLDFPRYSNLHHTSVVGAVTVLYMTIFSARLTLTPVHIYLYRLVSLLRLRLCCSRTRRRPSNPLSIQCRLRLRPPAQSYPISSRSSLEGLSIPHTARNSSTTYGVLSVPYPTTNTSLSLSSAVDRKAENLCMLARTSMHPFTYLVVPSPQE